MYQTKSRMRGLAEEVVTKSKRKWLELNRHGSTVPRVRRPIEADLSNKSWSTLSVRCFVTTQPFFDFQGTKPLRSGYAYLSLSRRYIWRG